MLVALHGTHTSLRSASGSRTTAHWTGQIHIICADRSVAHRYETNCTRAFNEHTLATRQVPYAPLLKQTREGEWHARSQDDEDLARAWRSRMPPELAVAYAGEELQLNLWYMYSHLLVILLVIPLILARVREAMRVNCQKVGKFDFACVRLVSLVSPRLQ